MKTMLLIFFILLSWNIIQSQKEDIKLASNGRDPYIAVDNAHIVHIAWSESSTPLQYAQYDTSGVLQNNLYNISYLNGPRSPYITIRDTQIVLVWQQREATFNSYIDGQLFYTNKVFLLNNIRYNEPYFDALRGGPQVAWLNDTSYIVLWGGDGYLTPVGGTGIYGRLVSSSNIFLSPDLLLSDHGFEGVTHGTAKVVVNEETPKFFIVWVDNFSGNFRVFGRFFNFEGEPLYDSFLISEDNVSLDTWELDCKVDNKGNIVIVWGSGTLTEGEIKWRWIDYEGNFLTEIETLSNNHYKIANSVAVNISINSDGKMILVWENERSGKSEIYGQRFNSDRTKLGKSFKISSRENTYSQLYPKVDLHNNKIFTTWYEVDNIAEGVWLNITDFNDPLLDYRGVVDEITLDKKYVSSGIDSVLIKAKVNERTGYVLFAEIGDENGIVIDSIYLFNDGLHGDSLLNDSIFANYYLPPALLEQNYFINLHTSLSTTDTVSYKREKVGYFTTKGPIKIEDVIFNENDTILNPGEQIRFKIALKNYGVFESINDMHAIIQTDNPNILLQNRFVQYGDISNGQIVIPDDEFVLRIISDFIGDNNISFGLSIASKDTVYWLDEFVIHVDTVTSISNLSNIPIEYKLSQNYPNPFNPSTIIKYQIPSSDDVKLIVYNSLGQQVAVLIDKYQLTGKYSVKFNINDLPSGVYFYKLVSGSFSDVKKMVLIR